MCESVVVCMCVCMYVHMYRERAKKESKTHLKPLPERGVKSRRWSTCRGMRLTIPCRPRSSRLSRISLHKIVTASTHDNYITQRHAYIHTYMYMYVYLTISE